VARGFAAAGPGAARPSGGRIEASPGHAGRRTDGGPPRQGRAPGKRQPPRGFRIGRAGEPGRSTGPLSVVDGKLEGAPPLRGGACASG
jgi:hypothetical protein